MGKDKNMKEGDKSDHAPSTVFVANLHYSFTNSQLEETFSQVGPIRRCFMVANKGLTEHRGFGFVHFAVTEDANRAIELKNNSSVGGGKVSVKIAINRTPLAQRRPKGNQVVQSDDTSNEESASSNISFATGKHAKLPKGQEKVVQSDDTSKMENVVDIVNSKISIVTVKQAKLPKGQGKGKPVKPKKAIAHHKDVADGGTPSEKQRN